MVEVQVQLLAFDVDEIVGEVLEYIHNVVSNVDDPLQSENVKYIFTELTPLLPRPQVCFLVC